MDRIHEFGKFANLPEFTNSDVAELDGKFTNLMQSNYHTDPMEKMHARTYAE
jgi:hypothetical protein